MPVTPQDTQGSVVVRVPLPRSVGNPPPAGQVQSAEPRTPASQPAATGTTQQQPALPQRSFVLPM